ncbi:MAG: DUF973 family protein, partial [Candidatus Acidiferrales bacterium]
PVDSRFSTPAMLVLMALVSLVILVVAGLGVFYLLYQEALCLTSQNPATLSCIEPGTFLALAGILVVTAIVAVVGYIGLLVGIWRLGTRYGEGLFKAAAILLIFPGLSLVGAILIIVCCHSLQHRLRRGTSPTGFG